MALDFAIALFLPVRIARWLAYFPVGRSRRFRYLVPEGSVGRSPPEASSGSSLDPSLENALRVARDVSVPVRIPMGRTALLMWLRARWSKDELVVSFRYWPPVLPYFVFGAVFVGIFVRDYMRDSVDPGYLLLFLPVTVTPLLSLPMARYESARLTLELLELARPRVGAIPFEIDRHETPAPLRQPKRPRIERILLIWLGLGAAYLFWRVLAG